MPIAGLLTFGDGKRYVEIQDAQLDQVVEAFEHLNVEVGRPIRRSLTFSKGHEFLAILSVIDRPDRVLFLHVIEDHGSTRRYGVYKAEDLSVPRSEDDEDLLTAIDGSGEIEEVFLHETVSKQAALELLKYFYQQGQLPNELTLSKL